MQLEIYVDPLCPDSRQGLPILQRAVTSFPPGDVRLVVHIYALPYHRNSFLSAVGLFSAHGELGDNDTIALLQEVLWNRDKFSTGVNVSGVER